MRLKGHWYLGQAARQRSSLSHFVWHILTSSQLALMGRYVSNRLSTTSCIVAADAAKARARKIM